MSANLQYKELVGLLHHFGSFKGGVHQEQNYSSKPTKINGIALVSHVNCSLGVGDWYSVFTLDRVHVM